MKELWHELLPVLFGVALGSIWAIGERSLRKEVERLRESAIKDVEWWREYKIDRAKIVDLKRNTNRKKK